VTVKGGEKGGRNQEMVLVFLVKYKELAASTPMSTEPILGETSLCGWELMARMDLLMQQEQWGIPPL